MKIWAHRGSHGAGAALENTLVAFGAALAEGAEGIELDVHPSADGVPLVFHDEDTARLAADGSSLRLAGCSAAALQALPLRGGARMPTLAAVLALVGPEVVVNVEIKDATALDAVLRIVRAGPARVVLSSFDHGAMVEAARRAPDVPRAVLHESPPPDLAAALQAAGASAWHPRFDLVSADRVRLCHDLGVALRAWTVNDPALARRMAELGVDAVLSDHPGALRASLGRLQKK